MEPVIPVSAPAVSVADATALVQANQALQTQLAESRAQLARSAETDQATRKTAAIAEALANVPLVPGGLGHLTTILDKDLSFHTDPQTGKQVCVGPNLTPATAHIHSLLSRPEYLCFVRAQNPGGGTAGSSAGQFTHTPAPWAGAEAPPSNLTEAILRHQADAVKNLPPPTLTGGTFINDAGDAVRRPAAGFGGFGGFGSKGKK